MAEQSGRATPSHTQTDKAGGSPRVTRPSLPETDRVTPMTHPQAATSLGRQAAYRRLALTILALDVPTLSAGLQARRLPPRRLPQALPRPARRAA